MDDGMQALVNLNMPGWVPAGALHYLAHTECGQPIRALARAAGCHASTVLRQIRQIETRRDDPLVDAALRKLGAVQHESLPDTSYKQTKERTPMAQTHTDALPDEPTLAREAMRVLRRLCETGAVLAVASEMDKAVVVRDMASGGSTRTAVVASTVAQAMALKNWIAPGNTGRIIRYHITTAGRAALREMLAQMTAPDDAPHRGFCEAQTAFAPAQDAWNDDGDGDLQDEPAQRAKYNLAESPLAALARRRDPKGKPFLGDDLVHAGERLREDFELAQMAARVTQNWDHFLTPGTGSGHTQGSGMADAPSAARARVAAALADLGPGLSDVVLRCCCYLEGLETTEKRLGWSARSGKIVLRIALMRLKRHYDETIGPGGPMIG
tara:strand:+ start:3242 stop:4387 length:1146 start_codon:yes stop_codon:yes gene_type:complete